MNYIYKSLLVVFLSISYLVSYSQDIHYTQNHYAPTYFNPAQTGAFNGTYRINGIYRDQNRAFFGTSYQTPMLSVDSPFMWGFKKNHWVGGGLTLYTDKAGEHKYSSSGLLGSLAYHVGLDKKLRNVLTVGVRYGIINRTIDDAPEVGVFGEEIAGQLRGKSIRSMDRDLFNQFSGNYSSLSTGIMLKMGMGKTSSFEIGVAGANLLKARYNFMASPSTNEIEMRINAHAKLNMTLGKQFGLSPIVYYSLQGPSTMVVAQLHGAYQLTKMKKNEKKDPVVLYPGIGFRVGDAIQLMFGMAYKKYKVSIGYDYSINDYNAYTTSGALEIGVQRIFEIKKKPEIVPIIFCPRI